MADKKKQPEDDMAEGLKSNLDKLLGRSSEENEGEPENARWPRFETPPPAVSNLGHRYRLNKQALFTLKSILYFFATYGLKIKSIPPTIFETMLKEVNVQGDALSRNIEYGKVVNDPRINP